MGADRNQPGPVRVDGHPQLNCGGPPEFPSVAGVIDIQVEAPPAVPRRADTGAARVVPVVLAVVSAGVAVFLLTSRPGSAHSPAMFVFPLMMLLSAGAAVLSGGAGRWRAELNADRRRYLRYLDSVSDRLADAAAAQRDRLWSRHPAPEDLWTLPPERLWDRTRTAPDFGTARVGRGSVDPEVRAVGPDVTGAAEPDPVTAAALDRLLRTHESVPDTPVTVDLAAASEIAVGGPAERARALARAVICQLAIAHGPADLAISVEDPCGADWDWLKWLPHQRVRNGSMHHLSVRIVPLGGERAELCLEVDGVTMPTGRPDGLSAIGATALARRIAGHRSPQPGSGVGPDVRWDSGTGLQGIRIGTTVAGEPLELDIREAALGGIGPHGLCVGATGSGKSELLRTIALGIIARHSPATVNLILIDFKGGATFLDLARAPHTTAVVTNLDEEAHLVDRMREALTGEIDRRQRLLRAAGNLSSANALPELPTLFIVVDEFAELLSRHPEFAEIFVAIGRQGRSLGIHLLLASQRLEEGRLRGLESHLSYRICLKTLSETESRMVIGVPDAHHLPARPGAAYLKAAAAEPVPFHAGYVSGRRPVRSRISPAPRLFTGPEASDPACGPTLLDTVLDAVAGRGPAPHPVWLAPLTGPPDLAVLLAEYPEGMPIGVVDRVYEHRREPLFIDLAGAAGNVAVVGGPRSGKTTAVRTLVTALAATRQPRRAHVYCLDFGGGGLAELAELPHVGVVAPGNNPDLLRRTVADVLSVLHRREAGEDAAGAAVFLVVDGWGAARREYDELESALGILAGAGLAHDVHLVVTAGRWADIRAGLRDQLGTRIELRLGDPADSEIDRARAAAVPRDRPGHGLGPDGLPIVIARPGGPYLYEADGWRVPPVRLLPSVLDHDDLLAQAASSVPVLGVDEVRLEPVGLDLAAAHLLVLGEPGSGKTAVLRLLCREIARTEPDAEVVLLDPRGAGLHPVAPILARLRQRLDGEKGSATTSPDAQIYLMVDDYALAATALTPLADLLPHARDIGLRVVIARASGGAARALYDPVLSALRESGPIGLQLSAAPDEGPLVGTARPRRLPPGRGVLVGRSGDERTIQVAWTEPA